MTAPVHSKQVEASTFSERDRERFWSKVDKTDTCWVWCAATAGTGGYGVFRYGGKYGPYVRAHRLSYALTHGLCPANTLVCHHCDNPPCVNPDHLFLGDHRANALDMAAKGRQGARPLRGARHPMARLTEDQVREIRALYEQGRPEALAARFGISRAYVYRLINGQNWADLSQDEGGAA